MRALVDIQALPTISIAIASAGVFVAAIYYILQIRHQTKMRQTDLVIRLSSFLDNINVVEAMTKIFATDFKDHNELVQAISSPTLIMIADFYERIGALLKRKLIDVDLVYDIVIVTPIWEKMKPFVVYTRQRFKMPELFEYFEYLHNEMKKREQQLASK